MLKQIPYLIRKKDALFCNSEFSQALFRKKCVLKGQILSFVKSVK